jgi:hypothetical protein
VSVGKRRIDRGVLVLRLGLQNLPHSMSQIWHFELSAEQYCLPHLQLKFSQHLTMMIPYESRHLAVLVVFHGATLRFLKVEDIRSNERA